MPILVRILDSRFGHWLTLCTLNIHLLTYILSLVVLTTRYKCWLSQVPVLFLINSAICDVRNRDEVCDFRVFIANESVGYVFTDCSKYCLFQLQILA